MGSKSGLSLEANSSEKHLIKTDFKTDNLKQKSFRLSRFYSK